MRSSLRREDGIRTRRASRREATRPQFVRTRRQTHRRAECIGRDVWMPWLFDLAAAERLKFIQFRVGVDRGAIGVHDLYRDGADLCRMTRDEVGLVTGIERHDLDGAAGLAWRERPL